MKVAVTGTPGTGKTTATELLERAGPDADNGGAPEADVEEAFEATAEGGFEVVHLNEVVRERGFTQGRDEQRDTVVADLDAVESWLEGHDESGPLLVESHLSHHLDVDRVVVLRCDPALVEQRLRQRGEPDSTARENAESEALAGILAEAVEAHGPEDVYEVVTTDRGPAAVAREIAAVVRGEREPSAGTVSYVDYLE